MKTKKEEGTLWNNLEILNSMYEEWVVLFYSYLVKFLFVGVGNQVENDGVEIKEATVIVIAVKKEILHNDTITLRHNLFHYCR